MQLHSSQCLSLDKNETLLSISHIYIRILFYTQLHVYQEKSSRLQLCWAFINYKYMYVYTLGLYLAIILNHNNCANLKLRFLVNAVTTNFAMVSVATEMLGNHVVT